MNELELKYGCNPNQKPARVFMKNGGDLPFTVLNGKPGYINLLDAFNSWQLVRELKRRRAFPPRRASSMSPPRARRSACRSTRWTSRFTLLGLTRPFRPSPVPTSAPAARTRLCSYGDWAALSDECDAATAAYLKGEVSDGIIAPAYSDEALAILKTKKGGKYNIVQIDPAYTPAPQEQKDVFGVTFEQGRNNCKIDESLLANIVTENKNLPDDAKRDMIVSLITLKYTQSNSVCYAKDGQTIGVGAGQQSRIHCTRLAGQKADNWYLRRHPKVLALSFVDGIRRPDRDNAIDVYISDECDDVLADGAWQRVFQGAPRAADGAGAQGLGRPPERRDRRLGRLFPLRRQCRARAKERRFPTSSSPAARSATTTSSRPRTNTASPWPLPDRDCSITKRRNETNEAHGHRRRRPRTRHH